MKRALALFALTIVAAMALAGDVPSARTVLSEAQTIAKKDGKNVMVIFHASWCGWCKKLDAFLDDKAMKTLMERNLVIVHLDVLESEDKKAEENAGGEDVMVALKGKDAGLPFTAITDATGKLLINSNEKKEGTAANIGYPAAPNEIAHFIKMLEKGAPKMTASERAAIADWLKKNAPKPQ